MRIYRFVGTTDVFYDRYRGCQKGNEKLKSLKNLKIQFKGWTHLNPGTFHVPLRERYTRANFPSLVLVLSLVLMQL